MIDTELCARLWSGKWLSATTCQPAADRIEALLGEVDRLRAENERLREALKRSDNLLRCFVRKGGAIVDAVRAQTRAALNKIGDV